MGRGGGNGSDGTVAIALDQSKGDKERIVTEAGVAEERWRRVNFGLGISGPLFCEKFH